VSLAKAREDGLVVVASDARVRCIAAKDIEVVCLGDLVPQLLETDSGFRIPLWRLGAHSPHATT
jgi:hypothetical protein